VEGALCFDHSRSIYFLTKTSASVATKQIEFLEFIETKCMSIFLIFFVRQYSVKSVFLILNSQPKNAEDRKKIQSEEIVLFDRKRKLSSEFARLVNFVLLSLSLDLCISFSF
jgi:hypothetical protein